MDSPSRPPKPIAIRLLRIAIIALVVAGIGLTLRSALQELSDKNIQLTNIHWGWLALVGITYLLGMLPPGIYYHVVLKAMGGRPTWRESVRAFYFSQLGKYVPGKAMVVVLRAGSVKSERVAATVAATAVFVETLTWIAVGAAIGLFLLAFFVDLNPILVGFALALLGAAAIPTWPPIFRRLVRLLQVRRANPDIDQALLGLNVATVAKGWLILSMSWLIMGFSLFFTLQSLPGVSISFSAYPVALAGVSLAVVVGFVSLLPGGIGVRELVMIPLLRPLVGTAAALMAVVLLRLIWLIADLCIVGIIQLVPALTRRFGKSTPPSHRASAGKTP